ncbi:helix-turn-helix domain-containing protein [Streptomyces sp. NPDC057250]|uniref:helix-turn-helix domain-containing protein n=1 Tax=Streptomyces sp. NPDC057250 TaxID=3346068 RepID=UPI00362C826A
MSTTTRSRLTGTERAEAAARVSQDYTAGSSIRATAESAGLSYGTTRKLLLETGTVLRSRGGNRGRKTGR